MGAELIVPGDGGPLSAAEIRAAIVVTDNGNASDVNQIAAVGATVQEGLLLSVTLASPIYSNGFLYLALNSGTAYPAICAAGKGAGYRGVSTGEVEAGIPYLFQWSTIGGGRWILQSRSYITPGDMPDLGFAQVYLAGNLTGQGGSYATVTVAFSTVYFNTQSNFSFAGGVATCLVAGRYQIVSQLARSTPGYHFIRVNSNNLGVVYTTTEAWTQCVLTIDLQAGDTVRTSIASSGAATIYGGDSPFVGSGDATWMSLRRVK